MEHKCRIKLSAEDVKDFVRAAGACDFDVDIFYNRVIIDAKSILGVLSLDLTKTLTVCYSEKNSSFEYALEKYCVA